ncbi:hypothetical protein [Georgenia sp. H159]|uniref:hypothetical protein n=1 Tax=Georgenia sp. H159 TaxID=3076115 RepID=UPI002D782601|nr:hypothetical protein [Georgenia sp. H159]
MSLADAPQWLVSAFVRSAVAVGATADRTEIQRTASTLVERWQQPERRFHNLRHLTDVLARVEELAEETHDPDVVRLAAWYHGAAFNASAAEAYARRGGEDEVGSAALAREELTALGVPDAVADRVSELILNLARHDADEHDVDALALCDADLGTLAVEPQKYAAYRKAIREEYAHIPELDYVGSRVAILARLLQRRRLFVSPFSLAWEEPARENLTAELSHLRSKLAKLGGTEAPREERPGRPAAASWPSRRSPARADGPGPASAPVGDDAATRSSGARAAAAADARATRSPAAPAGGAGQSAATLSDADADAGATDAVARPSAAVSATTPPSGATPDEPARLRERREQPPPGVAESLSGIERDPDFEVRRRARAKRRRDRSAAQLADASEQSPGSLFRPPPKMPRS